jgi:hypothetical protein
VRLLPAFDPYVVGVLQHLERLLPVTGQTRIELGPQAAGRLGFTCAAGHYPGSIIFR